jgi:hypothetical protein
MFMTMAGFIILVLLVLLLIWIFVELAKLPGAKARERKHPQADAINVLGWLGLLMGGVGWVVAVVWAYTKPVLVVVAADASPADVGEAVRETLEKKKTDEEESGA